MRDTLGIGHPIGKTRTDGAYWPQTDRQLDLPIKAVGWLAFKADEARPPSE
ncbi:hypothetical protein MN186_09070 [Aliiroseovarius sp. N1F302]|uniref:hypothetical protein n=1 Tax=Aliiroseovarius sediminis TaxID=2925839 RepID=UPI001F5A5DCF|nr:hypothetical protein [Aliiroseovarius sediminis]MCI2394616.1 hypothetical protein [Aliiroseovarius sediminis]